jgi:hypothetical protein
VVYKHFSPPHIFAFKILIVKNFPEISRILILADLEATTGCRACGILKRIGLYPSNFAYRAAGRIKNSNAYLWLRNTLVGLTPTGRATVETLKLNREGLINLRRVLYVMGEHPPGYPGYR